jgi:hypothetical protein
MSDSVELFRVLLPEVVVVQQMSAEKEGIEVAECRFILDDMLPFCGATNDNKFECAVNVKGGQRSRGWRILVRSVYSTCLVVKGHLDCESDSQKLSQCWVSWDNLNSLSTNKQSCSSGGNGLYLGSFIALRGEFLETEALEVDVFQVYIKPTFT